MKKVKSSENKRKTRHKAAQYYARMLSNLTAQINHRTLDTNVLLKKYVRAHLKDVCSIKADVAFNEIFDEIKRKDIILFGNFRTDNGPRYYLLDILKKLVDEGNDIAVGIDLFPHRKRKYLESYQNGQTTKRKLSLSMNFDSLSYDSFLRSYFAVLDFLKSRSIPVIPLDTGGVASKNLMKKDVKVARMLALFKSHYRNSKLICLVPDSWLAKNHLPAELSKALKKFNIKSDFLRIFSGSDRIYQKLLNEMKEKSSNLVKCSANTYILNLSHPVERYNSFLNYLDGERELDKDKSISESFLEILESINKKFALGINVKSLNYKLYANFEIDFIEEILKTKSLKDYDKKGILEYVLKGEGFYIPRGQIIYLGNLSKLHASEEAGHYIRNVLAGIDKAQTREDKFYINVVNEALAFMASKLIVPLRTPIETNIINMAVTPYLVDSEKENLMIHTLGYRLGDKLYKASKRGKLSKRSIKGMFSRKFSRQGEAKRYYSALENIAEK